MNTKYVAMVDKYLVNSEKDTERDKVREIFYKFSELVDENYFQLSKNEIIHIIELPFES